MFYIKKMVRTVLLHPQYFEKGINDTLKKKLFKEVQGQCLGRDGYCIAVLEMKRENIGRGKLQTSSGLAVFHISFHALMLRPFKNEVLVAVAKECTKMGVFASLGPLNIFISRHGMPDDMMNGWDPNSATWTSEDNELVIRKETPIMLRIMNCQVSKNEWRCVGTLRANYLGPVEEA